MMGGVFFRIFGNTKLYNMGGLMDDYPRISLLFAIPLFALVGIPPLSGFWPKLSLFGASYEVGSIAMLIVFIFASLITLIIIAKVWNNIFAKNARKTEKLEKLKYFDQFNFREKYAMIFPIMILVSVILYYSVFAEHILLIAERIGSELMNPGQYVNSVLKLKEGAQ